MKYDDDLIAEIDKEMGWIEEDGSSPSKTARDLGMHCKFMDGPFSATAWGGPNEQTHNIVWSVCVLSGNRTTLLAKSFPALEKLYRKLREREPSTKRWLKYYSAMWERRYKKWCCKKDSSCECQLCRIERGKAHENNSNGSRRQA